MTDRKRAASSDQRTAPRSNVLWLSLVSLLNDAASEMIYPLLPLFLVSTLGAGPAILGVIEGVADSTSSFVKLAGGWLSDRVARRKPWIAAGYGLAAFARPLLAAATAPWHVLAVRFTDRMGKGVRTAPRDALLAESVEASRHGTAFGIHRAADHAGAVIGPLAAAAFLALYPGALRPLFALALVPGIIALAVVLFRVRETSGEQARGPVVEPEFHTPPGLGVRPGDGTGPRAKPGASSRPDSAPAPGFYRYLAVLTLFTLGNASDAFLLLRARQLGIDLAVIPLLWAALHVSKMAWSVPGGALADRHGARRAILGGWTIYGLVYLGFALAVAEWHVWLLFLTYGLFYGLTEAPEKALVATFAGPAGRGYAFGAYHLAIGLTALPASLAFGWIWERWSAEAAFVFGACASLLAMLLFPLLVRPAADSEDRAAKASSQ